ncbi:MAG: DegV family protein [Christensenellales bacterium]|jgi:EDD domain protein, degV family
MIIISSDSTSDLNELFKTRNIPTLPLAVILGDKSYEDGITVTPDDIYAFVKENGILPKTAARSVAEHKEFFSSIRKNKDDSIIHFTISGEISVTAQNALEAAKAFDNVYVIDGKSLSTGTGLLVMYACDLRDSGKYSAKEIYEKCLARIPYVQASFFVDTMEYLYKGGRCSGLASFFATALKLKPSLLLKDGKIVVGKKFRGSAMSIADKYVENIFDMYDNPDLKRIFITHTSADPEVVKLVRDTVNKRYKFSEIYETIASSTITSHCGKGTLGILFINDGPHEI